VTTHWVVTPISAQRFGSRYLFRTCPPGCHHVTLATTLRKGISVKSLVLRATVGQVTLAMVLGLGSFSSAHAFVSPTTSNAPQLLSSEMRGSGGNASIEITTASTGLPFEEIRRPLIQVRGAPVFDQQTYVGETLFASMPFGDWVPLPTTMTYQWFANGIRIKRATSAYYTLTSRQVDKRISVRAVGSRESYVTTTSEPSDEIRAVLPARPFVSTAAPEVTGSPVVGGTLYLVMNTFWDAGGMTVGYSRQWLRNGKAIKGQTGNSYVVTPKDVRKRISVRLTGVADGYIAESRTSIPTAKVTR